MEELKKIVDDIHNIEIQGATNVAMTGIKAFSDYIQSLEIDKGEVKTFSDKMENAREILSTARPTEPGLINGLKHIIQGLNMEELKPENLIANVKQRIGTVSSYYIKFIKEAKEVIGEIGARKIESGMVIMTHCHSSVVSNIFRTAKQLGKEFQVICTETRPKFQGKITVRELLESNIPTSMIVDSAMRWILKHKQVDLIITGCDSITSEGTVINKIGSRLLALAAHEMDVPYYAATPLIKYDPDTSLGHLAEIEERSPGEIWEDAPDSKKLTILNPAFETISREYIDALITDVGVFPPTLITQIYKRNFYELIEKLRDL
ncbi:MAG: S-methyl-5-thioribose-1-phosphate isomerase [Candidatus Lokiarchaeota archaeon]|nr:S-methyl-5-thioribose-1-phosphate isomerase [Candidatus Lokiarchaeota archaeon]